jgi:hypothetical protein
MQTANTQRACAETNRCYTGPCPGYGTRTDCPPLIVLAVRPAQSTEPIAELTDESRGRRKSNRV